MSGKDEELEFISVQADDDDGNAMTLPASYASAATGDDSTIGSWIFKQSKVKLRLVT